MDTDLTVPPRKRAVTGYTSRTLLCLRPRRQKKKVAYSTYIHKLLNQTWSAGASCLAAATLAWLGSPQLLRDVALEATRLSRCSRRSHLSHREVLLAMKLVLLRELSKTSLASSSCELLLDGHSKMGQS